MSTGPGRGPRPGSGPAGAPSTTSAPGTPRTAPDDAMVPRSVRVAAAWSWRLLLIGLALAVLVLAMAVGKVIWVPVVVALLLTVLLGPVVQALVTRLRMPRGAASAVTVVALLVVVGGLLTLAGREIVQGFSELWDRAVAGYEELLVWLEEGPLGIDSAQLAAYVDQAGEQIGSNSGSLVSGALSVTTTIGHVLAGAVIAVFCLLFFLKDGRQIWAWLLRLLPVTAREPAHEAARRGAVTLVSYTRAQILVAFVDALGIGLGAAILGIPLALPLGILVFLASFIPFVGAIATGIIAVLVALVDQGPGTALIMLLIVLGVQQLEGNVLQPLLLGRAVSLHPVAVLLSVTAGSLAAGIVGALLAVPAVATLNTVVLYLHGRDKFPSLGRDPDDVQSRLRRLESAEDEAEHEASKTAPDAGAPEEV